MILSVVVPVYNVERYLVRCMDSLLAQSYSDFELILVDDGSTDSSGLLCDRFAAQHANIQVVHQKNGGLGMARNAGLDCATGEYVLFLDSDDYFGPELLNNLLDEAQRTGADLVIGGHTVVGADGKKSSSTVSCERVFRTPEEMKNLLLYTVGTPPEESVDSLYGVSACGRLYRRSIIEQYGLRFVSERQLISEDLIFNLDFLRNAHSAAVITDASYFYCANDGSLTNHHRMDRFAQDCVLYSAVEERLKLWYLEEEYRLPLARLLISRARYDIGLEVDYHDLSDRNYPLGKQISAIVRRPELRRVLSGYPWWRLPWMQAVFAGLMQWRAVWVLPALVRAKQRLLTKT